MLAHSHSGFFHIPLLCNCEHTVSPYLKSSRLTLTHGRFLNVINVFSTVPGQYHSHVHAVYRKSFARPRENAWMRMAKRQGDHKSLLYTPPPEIVGHSPPSSMLNATRCQMRCRHGEEWTYSGMEKKRRMKHKKKKEEIENGRKATHKE